MASRTNIRRKRAGKRGKGKTKAELRRLLRKAQIEVEKLLQADEAGTLTRASLKARLEQTEEYLEEIEPFEDDPT